MALAIGCMLCPGWGSSLRWTLRWSNTASMAAAFVICTLVSGHARRHMESAWMQIVPWCWSRMPVWACWLPPTRVPRLQPPRCRMTNSGCCGFALASLKACWNRFLSHGGSARSSLYPLWYLRMMPTCGSGSAASLMLVIFSFGVVLARSPWPVVEPWDVPFRFTLMAWWAPNFEQFQTASLPGFGDSLTVASCRATGSRVPGRCGSRVRRRPATPLGRVARWM